MAAPADGTHRWWPLGTADGTASLTALHSMAGNLPIARSYHIPKMPTAAELKKLKVAELKELLTQKGLDTTGVKDVLIERLLASEEGGESKPAEAEAAAEEPSSAPADPAPAAAEAQPAAPAEAGTEAKAAEEATGNGAEEAAAEA